MAKRTFDSIYLEGESKAYNYSHYKRKEAIADFILDFGGEVNEEQIFVSYFRYLTKEEIKEDGDWENIAGYEDGSMTLYEECYPDERGAFKCWVIERG